MSIDTDTLDSTRGRPVTGTNGHRPAFYINGYFGDQGVRGGRPEITIAVLVSELHRRMRVPLPLSPYAYATYQGG